jgi:hypothetical protein
MIPTNPRQIAQNILGRDFLVLKIADNHEGGSQENEPKSRENTLPIINKTSFN